MLRQNWPPGTARRVALRMLFRALRETGVPVHDPTLDLALPPTNVTGSAPVDRRRGHPGPGRHPARSLRAALRCSAPWLGRWPRPPPSPARSPQIRIRDLDDPDQPRWVHLPGTRRTDPRLAELTDWGATIVARQTRLLRDRRLPSSTLLTYRGAGEPGQHVAQAAVCNAIAAVLASAGLSDEPDVRPASVRNWAGRRLYDGGMPIEDVARRLGARRLDGAAEDIALEWRVTP